MACMVVRACPCSPFARSSSKQLAVSFQSKCTGRACMHLLALHGWMHVHTHTLHKQTCFGAAQLRCSVERKGIEASYYKDAKVGAWAGIGLGVQEFHHDA